MRGIFFFLQQMENSQVITTIKNLEQIIFIELCMNVWSFAHFKGK